MRYSIAPDARPQVRLLLAAAVLSILIWAAAWYLPAVGLIVYPLQLFATFIHEGSHVLASLLTGSSVQSLTVSPDTSGEVYSLTSGWFGQLLISSAGYIGTTAFGAALLAWLRFGYSTRKALYFSAGAVGALTIIFGVLAPLLNFFSSVTFGGLVFTVFAGIVLTVLLACAARFLSSKWVVFAVAFLAIQCLLNAVFSLFELVLITGYTNSPSDAANMASATGVPAIVWAFVWIAVSILLISVGMRLYAVSARSKAESVFQD